MAWPTSLPPASAGLSNLHGYLEAVRATSVHLEEGIRRVQASVEKIFAKLGELDTRVAAVEARMPSATPLPGPLRLPPVATLLAPAGASSPRELKRPRQESRSSTADASAPGSLDELAACGAGAAEAAYDKDIDSEAFDRVVAQLTEGESAPFYDSLVDCLKRLKCYRQVESKIHVFVLMIQAHKKGSWIFERKNRRELIKQARLQLAKCGMKATYAKLSKQATRILCTPTPIFRELRMLSCPHKKPLLVEASAAEAAAAASHPSAADCDPFDKAIERLKIGREDPFYESIVDCLNYVDPSIDFTTKISVFALMMRGYETGDWSFGNRLPDVIAANTHLKGCGFDVSIANLDQVAEKICADGSPLYQALRELHMDEDFEDIRDDRPVPSVRSPTDGELEPLIREAIRSAGMGVDASVLSALVVMAAQVRDRPYGPFDMDRLQRTLTERGIPWQEENLTKLYEFLTTATRPPFSTIYAWIAPDGGGGGGGEKRSRV